MKQILPLLALTLCTLPSQAELTPAKLRVEYLHNPVGIDSAAPRLSWQVVSSERGQKQTAYRILVSSAPDLLRQDRADLWDSGKVESNQSIQISYGGQTLTSRQQCFWKIRVWDANDAPSPWSPPAHWSMGLLQPTDWKGEWISFKDNSPVHNSRQKLELPPARHYRKAFPTSAPIKRATVYASALGIFDLHLNGQRVSERFFAPGWSDYLKRAYYTTYDVTRLIVSGENMIGAVVADGWYAGYVGYGLLVGYGPNRSGRNFYGKTPAFMAQLEIEYADGRKEIVATDTSWQVSGDGPHREADMIMGETYDARQADVDWCRPARDSNWNWSPVIRAKENGSIPAVSHDNRGSRPVELGFQKPPLMQAYSAPPIVITGELPARKITEPKPGTYIFDLGQNFAGVIRLKVKSDAGRELTLRYGEMLHPDGRLMTENLRRARATDHYICRGDAAGETWVPRFTYHGFQYVEVTGLSERPGLEAATGLAINNDMEPAGEFACSDDVMTQFWRNTTWTQRANFIELPTDCPQRDERLGWMGDAQIYARTASFNADVAAFFTKWLDDVEEAQRSFGAYPDYCPYPMGHGQPGKTFGTAWMDAGIICPWTVWKVYGDTRVIERHWDSMTRFMEWREAVSPGRGGVSIGNPWGDWLNVNETTPIELIDAAYFARTCALMAEMAEAIGRPVEAGNYQRLFNEIRAAFQKEYLKEDGSLSVDTQTAYALAIDFGLLNTAQLEKAGVFLARKVADNDHRMATGFLGTKRILPALTRSGHFDLAVRLFQSRRFPSWGYEVVNGANSVWERWDSYTVEHGFNGMSGNQNASMNSFSHYSFGAVMEWGFRHLAGIDSLDAGYGHILIRPGIPDPGSNPDQTPIHWVNATYQSIRGPIHSEWRRTGAEFELDITVPANTTARVQLPVRDPDTITENAHSLADHPHVQMKARSHNLITLEVASGDYRFKAKL